MSAHTVTVKFVDGDEEKFTFASFGNAFDFAERQRKRKSVQSAKVSNVLQIYSERG